MAKTSHYPGPPWAWTVSIPPAAATYPIRGQEWAHSGYLFLFFFLKGACDLCALEAAVLYAWLKSSGWLSRNKSAETLAQHTKWLPLLCGGDRDSLKFLGLEARPLYKTVPTALQVINTEGGDRLYTGIHVCGVLSNCLFLYFFCVFSFFFFSSPFSSLP